ncbi:hypothetical protein IscW_ISCW015745 [Ixodes scapularis]|uniref:Uncharacterized protein n=1 Tax=Ixodes scapularis TaxID=6945 RepID=B7P179_IXOSC|nr:hypothetical protein IscW_ISCW015745 [Ixodes scapularis]|eukprot:XP_002400566.1 hypothetical protein IscW_ISCW015745 [Ixodes scapularis]
MDPVDADVSDFFCYFASEERGRNNGCAEAALEPAPAVGRAERVGAALRPSDVACAPSPTSADAKKIEASPTKSAVIEVLLLS